MNHRNTRATALGGTHSSGTGRGGGPPSQRCIADSEPAMHHRAVPAPPLLENKAVQLPAGQRVSQPCTGMQRCCSVPQCTDSFTFWSTYFLLTLRMFIQNRLFHVFLDSCTFVKPEKKFWVFKLWYTNSKTRCAPHSHYFLLGVQGSIRGTRNGKKCSPP